MLDSTLIVSVPSFRATLSRRLSVSVIAGLILALIACIALNRPLQCEAFLVPLILVGTVLSPTMLFSRILATWPMRLVGRISYSLYLWQQLFLVGWKGPRPLPFGSLQEWQLNIVAVFACAAASYYLLERPLVGLGHSLSAGYLSPRNQKFAVAEPAPR